MKIITADQARQYAIVNFPSFPKDWYISPHFTWNEVFVNELRKYGVPSLAIFENAVKASKQFEKIRELLGLPMNVHCWFRSLLHNLALKEQGLNPAMHSSHLYGLALDYDVPGMTMTQVRGKLLEAVKKQQLKIRIEANTAQWVHCDIGNPYTNDYNWGIFNP